MVVAGGALLHDVGMSIHRADHEAYSLFLASGALEPPARRRLPRAGAHASSPRRSCTRSSATAAAASPTRSRPASSASPTRSTWPRAGPGSRSRPGQEGIHSISAAAIDEVRIEAGEERPVRIEIELNNSAGIFQVDDLLATKIRGTPLEGRVEVVAEVEGESEKRLLSGFRLQT